MMRKSISIGIAAMLCVPSAVSSAADKAVAYPEGYRGWLTGDGGVSCFNCHASEKKADYVYSQYRP